MQGIADGVVYMWSAVSGKFYSVLEGPLEKVVDITWHPHLNVLAAVAAGKVHPLSMETPKVQHINRNQCLCIRNITRMHSTTTAIHHPPANRTPSPILSQSPEYWVTIQTTPTCGGSNISDC